MNQEFQPPQGYELDKENSTDETIIYKKKEKKYPVSTHQIKGRMFSIERDYYANRSFIPKYISKKTDLSTKERAEAFLALMQLVELRDAWNEINGFEADWCNLKQEKHIIEFVSGNIFFADHRVAQRTLHFGSGKISQLFYETFRDLIETAKELL